MEISNGWRKKNCYGCQKYKIGADVACLKYKIMTIDDGSTKLVEMSKVHN